MLGIIIYLLSKCYHEYAVTGFSVNSIWL